MNTPDAHTQPRRSPAARVALIVTATVSGLIAAGFLALGGLALWGDSERDKDGYLSTDSHHLAASTRALTSENIDLDFEGAESLFESVGDDIRLKVEPQGDEPVFVGIARTDEVSRYLSGVAHTTVTDFDEGSQDETTYSAHGGERKPAVPADQAIWAASAQGTGTQTLKWDIEDGDWSIVVMNADASRGVETDFSAGAKVSFLDELGWSSIGVGTFLVLAAGGLILLAVRRPRTPGGQAPIGGPSPSAA